MINNEIEGAKDYEHRKIKKESYTYIKLATPN